MDYALDPELAVVDAAEHGVLIPTWVYFDDMDPFGMLHNSRYTLLAERAWNTYWEERISADDTFGVVKETRITHDTPVTSSGPYAINFWIDRLGRTSITWGFRFCSRDESITYAHGARTSIRLDAETLRPAPWSDQARELAEKIMRPAR